MRLIILFMLLLSWIVNATELVWPPPPEKPKIKWVRSIEKLEDIGAKKGFFSKLADLLFGEEKKMMVKPFGSFIKGEKLYFTDTGSKSVFIFDFKEKKFSVIDHIGDYQLISPIDVAVDDKGKIYVSDSVLGTVFITNEDGDFLGKIGSNLIVRPTGLALDSKRKRLYIVDTLKGKIYVVSLKSKKLIMKIGKIGNEPGQFNRPTFLTIDKEGNIYVSDSMNARIQIFNPEGKFITMFGERGTTIGSLANPRGIAVDSDGNIYIADTLLSAIQVFNKKGELLLVIGHYGTNKGEFAFPVDISISPDDYIFVSDSYNMRIQVFRYLKGGK
ncbi:6-bladed beta-propeller [Persephonella sp. IF05-L8]|uniref:6-bladed beta-propeller n=1 Tax=Persephonella sp. IF05-L8 TaxID=1158338 RepID=UPI00068D204B